MKEETFSITHRGHRIAVTRAIPAGEARAAVAFLHGGPGGQRHGPANLYGDLAELLAGLSVLSVRFDFSGCGQSTGEYVNMTMAGQTSEFKYVYRELLQD